MSRLIKRTILSLAAVIFAIGLPSAQSFAAEGEAKDDLGDETDLKRGKNSAAIDAAVKKGCDWLLGQQTADNSWESSMRGETGQKCGTTALSLLALIKGGVDRKNPAIAAGFDYLRKNLDLKTEGDKGAGTYEVSCTVLALEAYHIWRSNKQVEEDEKMGLQTVPIDDEPKKNFHKNAGPDVAWMRDLIEWLVRHQTNMVWRYPGAAQDGSPNDASNTQYAMLALNAGRRLGFQIPVKTWTQVVEYFIQYQEKDGPEVESFSVPGADMSIKALCEYMKDLRKDLEKIAKKEKRKVTKEDLMGTSVEGLDFGGEGKMKARGWCYVPEELQVTSKVPPFSAYTGSMTTSGVAALMIAKAALEAEDKYKIYKTKCDQAIRDGAAWLSKHFTVTQNPNRDMYQYYFLYGMERAGVLSLCDSWGEHNWYEKGSEYLLKEQQGTGSWPARDAQSELVDTCFAILFLCRATTPIVPGFAETGAYLEKTRKDKPAGKEKENPPKK